MKILSMGRRRLSIDIRVERVPELSTQQAQDLYRDQQVRNAALAERTNWELDHLARTGWLR